MTRPAVQPWRADLHDGPTADGPAARPGGPSNGWFAAAVAGGGPVVPRPVPHDAASGAPLVVVHGRGEVGSGPPTAPTSHGVDRTRRPLRTGPAVPLDVPFTVAAACTPEAPFPVDALSYEWDVDCPAPGRPAGRRLALGAVLVLAVGVGTLGGRMVTADLGRAIAVAAPVAVSPDAVSPVVPPLVDPTAAAITRDTPHLEAALSGRATALAGAAGPTSAVRTVAPPPDPTPTQAPSTRASKPSTPPSGMLPASGSRAVPSSVRTASKQYAAAHLPDHGWSVGSQFGCLDRLWTRESGWNHLAKNPSSGAYGIPQSLPAKKLAAAGSDWQTNPRTQINWGLAYIKERYGTPCAAWAHSEKTGWY